jgi:hypothetical protein
VARSRKGGPPPAPWLNEGIDIPDLADEWRRKGGDHPPFRPQPVWNDGLGWEEVYEQELLALTDPGPLLGLRKALFRTLSRLRHGRMIYENSGEREGAKLQLEAVLAFFDLFRSLDILQSDMPLRALLRGLESLDRGAVEPMLLPTKKRTGRPVTLRSVLFRAYAAAGVELARRAGRKLDKAGEFVVAELDAAGYRVGAGHGDGRITGPTVLAWRREAREREAADPLREMYEKLLASDRSFSSRYGFEHFLDELRTWVPPENAENPPAEIRRKCRKPGLLRAPGRVAFCRLAAPAAAAST